MLRNKKFYENILKAVESYNAGEIIVNHYPVIGYIEPTSFCNLGCPSCPTGLKTKVRERSFLSYEKFCRLIDEWGDYLYLLYMYNWGEPFLNKDFIKMVKYTSLKGIMVKSSSNLNVNLSSHDAEEVVKSGLNSLKIGIDGITQETYEKYRRGGDLERVLRNVSLIAQAKKRLDSSTPLLVTNFHVFEHNEHEIAHAKNFLLEKGIDMVIFSAAFLPCAESYGIKPPKIYRQFDVKDCYDKLIPKDASVFKCTWLWFAMVYNPNGSISPCCGVTHEKHDFGKLEYEGTVLDAFNLPLYHQARALKSRRPMPLYKDSMGLSIEQNCDMKLICEVCPTPYIMHNFKPDLLLEGIIKASGYRK